MYTYCLQICWYIHISCIHRYKYITSINKVCTHIHNTYNHKYIYIYNENNEFGTPTHVMKNRVNNWVFAKSTILKQEAKYNWHLFWTIWGSHCGHVGRPIAFQEPFVGRSKFWWKKGRWQIYEIWQRPDQRVGRPYKLSYRRSPEPNLEDIPWAWPLSLTNPTNKA